MHHAFEANRSDSRMKQGLCLHSHIIHTQESASVTVGQIIQLTHRRRVLQKFFSF